MFHTENVYINSKVLCKSRKHYSLRSRKSQHQQIIYQPNLDIQSHKNDLSQKNIQAIPLYALLLQNLAVLAINHLLVFQKKVAAIGPVVKIQTNRIHAFQGTFQAGAMPHHILFEALASVTIHLSGVEKMEPPRGSYICLYVYLQYMYLNLAKTYFTNLDFSEIRGFPFLSYILG